MSRVVELLKKTPLRPLWWKVKGVPPISRVRHILNDIHADKYYFEWLPDIYNRYAAKPVNEKKVILVENHPSELSNTFHLIYRDLMEDGRFQVHVHYIGIGYLHRKESERHNARMVADLATARYVIQCEASGAISCLPMRKETTVIQLWHGCGAFKKFGRSTMDALFGQDRKHADRHPLYGNCDYVTVSSPEVTWAYEEAMGIDENSRTKVIPIGVSRTDVFFQESFLAGAKERVLDAVPRAREKKIILFAPTFRGRIAFATTPDYSQFDLHRLHRLYGDDAIILIKLHPYVKPFYTPQIPEDLKGSFAVDVTHTLSIEDLMIAADVCITDYSSLIFEYSLLDKPLVFYAYDLDEYYDWRGFYYSYDELTPGPVCHDMDELEEVLAHLEDHYDPGVMKAFRERFMVSCDGHSTERIEKLVFGESLRPSEERAESCPGGEGSD